MPKVTIEMVDDDDGMIFRMSGDPIPLGNMGTPAQLLGMSIAACLKGQFHMDVIEFCAMRCAALNKGEGGKECPPN